MPDKYRAPDNCFTKKGDLHHMNEDYENAPLEPPVEMEAGLPQSIPLDPGKLIDQLIRRIGAQGQQQTWENAQLAAENDALRTLLAEAQAQSQEDEAAIGELVSQLDTLTKRNAELGDQIEARRNSRGKAVTTPTGDPQPEADGFLAMASGQPGLASAPAPEAGSATTPRP